MSHAEIVTISPEIMSGTPVFCGTRVPIQNLLDYLKAGDSMVYDRSKIIDEFLGGFPTVRREQVIALLDSVGRSSAAGAVNLGSSSVGR
jgi:uncharacterized protein (DUF433 family)